MRVGWKGSKRKVGKEGSKEGREGSEKGIGS